MLAIEGRFWSKVAEGPVSDRVGTPCWLWTAGTFRRGYGQFTITHDHKVSAHRWSYEQMVGEIPKGLELDHLCRNAACVNPEHLEPVTHAENVRRGESWATSGAKTHCPSGHEYAGRNLYLRPSDGARVCRACMREHQRRARLRRNHAIARAAGY